MSAIHKLGKTDTAIRGALTPGRHSDGGGLYLQVMQAKAGADGKPRFSKSWIFRYRAMSPKTGKPTEREMGLGRYPDLGIADARAKAAEYRAMREKGIDPLADRDVKRARELAEAARTMTFRECAEAYMAAQERPMGGKSKQVWRNAKHRQQWTNTLATYVYPIMGDLPVSLIDAPLVYRVLEQPVKTRDPETGKEVQNRFWDATPETASRTRGRIETILDYAKARELRSGENPARYRGHVELAGFKLQKHVEHHAALPYAEMPAFLTDLQGRNGMAALALQFLIFTAGRTGEVLGARWSEINEREAVWIVPAERMKAGKPHRVPLSGRALAVLKTVELARRDDGLVFPGAKQGKPLSNMAMLELLRGMGKRVGNRTITTHGFRSTFRSWVAGCTSFPRELAEMALAHTIESKVEASYQRDDMLARRRELMNAWAAYCLPKANVVPFADTRKTG